MRGVCASLTPQKSLAHGWRIVFFAAAISFHHPFGRGLLKANPGRGGVKDNPSLLDAIVFHMMALERYSFDSRDCLSGPSAARSVSLFSRLFVLGIRLTIGSARGIFGVQFAVRDQKPYFTPFLQSWHQGFGRLTKHDAVTRFPIRSLMNLGIPPC